MSSEASRALESVLMVADNPVEPALLAQLLEMSPTAIEALCEQLAAEYRDADRGFVLIRVAGGYRFQSHPDMAGYVERFVLEGQSARMSAAALETLAIVAYKQPVSRAQIASIRGVNADGVMRTLQQRGYIDEIGRDPGPGQAVLYGTTSLFLERLGLDRIEDLPSLADFVPGPEVMEALEHSLRADSPTAAAVKAEADASSDDADAETPTEPEATEGPAAPDDDEDPGDLSGPKLSTEAEIGGGDDADIGTEVRVGPDSELSAAETQPSGGTIIDADGLASHGLSSDEDSPAGAGSGSDARPEVEILDRSVADSDRVDPAGA